MTQATTVAQATSNSKDDSNIMTPHNSRNASNIRNKATTGPPTQYANKSRKAVKIRDGRSSRDNSIIMDVINRKTARIDSREDNNIQQGHQQE